LSEEKNKAVDIGRVFGLAPDMGGVDGTAECMIDYARSATVFGRWAIATKGQIAK
jgi:hypothetical protein